MNPEVPNERIGKIVALAKRGVGGEKQNAIRMLKTLCKKHGLDFDSVMGENDFREKEYRIKYPSKEAKRVFSQIITRYVFDGDGEKEYGFSFWTKEIVFTTTQEKYIEALNATKILWRAYCKERRLTKDALFYGFLEKHDLYANPPKKKRKEDKITDEELKLRRMGSGMADAMDDVHIRKQLK